MKEIFRLLNSIIGNTDGSRNKILLVVVAVAGTPRGRIKML
jgi:hypothetical protein